MGPVPARLRRALPMAAAGVALALPTAAAGQAPLTLRACPEPAGFRCGTLTVPVDRADPAQGTQVLDVRVLPARGTHRGTIVFLAGGPGQSAITDGGGLEQQLRAAAPAGYEVVAFDQRGTGANALRCSSLDAVTDEAGAIAAAVQACAGEIGPRRVHFTTADSVADMDDLRAALGRARITPLGVSYGTLVATWYARLHPAQTAGLILDSVVGLRGSTVFEADGYAAAARSLAELCAARRCRGVTSDPVADVAALEARLATAGLSGRRVLASGRTAAGTFGGPSEATALFELYGSGDLNPDARGLFPAAVKLALRGDPALLFRIDGADSGPGDPSELSVGLFLATECGEADLPWTTGQATADRFAAATALLTGLTPGSAGPFRIPGTDASLVEACAGWPEAHLATPPAAALPDVPTLLVAGTQDVRTPLETARSVAQGLPRASLVRAVGSGHSSLSARTDCTLLAIRRFLRGSTVGQPCGEAGYPDIAPVPPRSVAALRPLGVRDLPGRTARAVIATLDDVSQAVSFGSGNSTRVRFRGLRGGRGLGILTPGGVRLQLADYVAVPGVVVSGTIRRGLVGPSVATLRVRGRSAAAGVVRLEGRRVTGTLGGRRLSFTR
ncbi:MAG: alpha/beta fold hydrolase [Thermoleophilia bacterium]|nr:alpha/beta fold hydrolase [Thermoleophilia bacterium]